MHKRTTKFLSLFMILGAHLTLFCAPLAHLFKLDNSYFDGFHNKLNIVRVIDVGHGEKCFNTDNTLSTPLITYHEINRTASNEFHEDNDKDWRLLEIRTIKNGTANSISLISTPFIDSCLELTSTESQFPAWKIDNGTRDDGKFLVRINHANDLIGKTLYLCEYDEHWSESRHLGEASRFTIESLPSHNIIKRDASQSDMPIITGFRIEHSSKEPEVDNGIPTMRAESLVLLRLFGKGFTNKTVVALTAMGNHNVGDPCQMVVTKSFNVEMDAMDINTVLVEMHMPHYDDDLYFCASNDDKQFYHQGNEIWKRIRSAQPLLPMWVQLIIISICLCFSALFSGLNLGLMSLDRTDLKILCNTGSESEKRYARSIQPVRDHGNFLLCSILLGNVLVNSTFTILLDSLTSGLIAVVCSTLLIVIFGEITPQAICSRHGLAVGAKTIVITKFVMLLTFPLSYPTSKLLDYLLGEEIGTYYNRERLKELVKVTTDVNDLDKDEVNIISGVLEMRKKTVGDIMTPIGDAYMLPIDSILDFETISEIMNSGYSRIPVYEGDRKNILSLLYIKDLAFVDTDDNTPLRTLCEFYQNPCHFVFDDLTLDVMFKQFKEGNKGHMAFVHRVNNDGEGDPFYETIGLVTLEDVIEELIQAEIMDETDVFTDNRTKIRRLRPQKQDFSFFVERRNDNHNVRISPQMTLAMFQYLSTTLDPFKKDNISENILRRLLNQDIFRHIKNKSKGKNDPTIVIFQQGKPVDFFVMILEGRVEVTVGRENLVFEGGPFTHFGLQALAQNVAFDSPQQQQQPMTSQVVGSLQSLNMDAMLRHTFVPDYSVRATSDVVYMVIKRSLYLAAKRATLMEHARRMGEHSNEPIDDEVEKLLHSLDEDDSAVHTTINSPRNTSKPGSMAPSPTASHPMSNLMPHDHSSDGGMRVTFSADSSSSNHIASFTNAQKTSMELNDGADASEGEQHQPLLLNRTDKNSKS